MSKVREIGEIGNYYGTLAAMKDESGCWWGIENWNGERGWEEIPEYLYDALMRFQDEKEAKQ